jgi:ferric-dicitrate binding protein FerR (iron transport regulator)
MISLFTYMQNPFATGIEKYFFRLRFAIRAAYSSMVKLSGTEFSCKNSGTEHRVALLESGVTVAVQLSW